MSGFVNHWLSLMAPSILQTQPRPDADHLPGISHADADLTLPLISILLSILTCL